MGSVAGKHQPNDIRKNSEPTDQDQVADSDASSDLMALKDIGQFEETQSIESDGDSDEVDAPEEEIFFKRTVSEEELGDSYEEIKETTNVEVNYDNDEVMSEADDNKEEISIEEYCQTKEYVDGEEYTTQDGCQYQEGDYEEGDYQEGQYTNDEGYNGCYTNNDYNEGYDKGYSDGYNSAFKEAYDQAYQCFENQLNQNKYQLDWNTLPKNVKKYYAQRYSIFSKFDDGIYMTSELWFSVTPESLAIFVAKFVQACCPEIRSIVDVFCGGGGNTIQFARRFNRVIAIDINPDNINCTIKNCSVYSVLDKVEVKQADWIKTIDTEYFQTLCEEVDLVFASPPWGGPGYKGQEVFDLDLLQPLPIKELLISFFKISSNVVLFLPKNSNLGQLAEVTRELLGPDAKCRLLYTYLNGYIKGIIAFWGEKFLPDHYTQVSQPQESEQIEVDVVDTSVYESRGHRGGGQKKFQAKNDVELDY